MKTLCKAVVALALSAIVASLSGNEIQLHPIEWSVVGESERPAIQELWAQTWNRIEDDLKDRVEWSESAEAVVKVSISGSANDWYAVMQLEGVESAPGAMKYLLFHLDDPTVPLAWSRAFEALCRPALPPLSTSQKPPTLVDAFSLDGLQAVDLPTGTTLMPYGLTVRPNGRLVVAALSRVVELDERWMVTDMPAEVLTTEGVTSYGYGVTLTPSGTLYVRTTETNGLWAFPEAAGTHQKVRIEAPMGSTFGVLSDGSPFVVSSQPKFTRVYRDGAETELRQAADSFVMAAAAGAEGTLWLFDSSKGSITITTADGLVRDVIYPEVPLGTALMKLKVLDDGSFLAVTNLDVRHFGPSGDLLWTWDPTKAGLAMTLSTINDLGVSSHGLLYINDYLSRKILRLSLGNQELSAPLAKVAVAAKRTREEPNAPDAWWALAEAYREMGATEALRSTLDTYLSLRPNDTVAKSLRTEAQVSLVKTRAEGGEHAFARALRDFGPETARDAYTRAMKTLEALKALAPLDNATSRRMTALKKALLDAENDVTPPPVVPQVVSVDLPPLFPALAQTYRTERAGSLVVRNEAEVPLKDLRAEVMIPKYMDFATPGKPVAPVAPSGSATLDLNVVLNDRVLEVEEDVALQAQVTLRWEEGGVAKSQALVLPVTLYRRSALTWEDTGKLSSFITPNDDAVARAAFQFLSLAPPEPLWPSSVAHARAIVDALGGLPLRYVADPKSDFRKVSTQSTNVDTVRFARTTLAYQGGDCDDTTALLASLLEAAGIPTAILTSPGHVFLAFDTGEPVGREWLYQGPGLTTLASGGTLWLPLESTDLGNGFTSSWKSASALVNEYRGTKNFEFLTVQPLRDRYPALPLPPATLPLPKADAERTQALGTRDTQALRDGLYRPLADRLTAEAGTVGPARAKALNRLAQVEARFGDIGRATEVLKSLVTSTPDYLPAYTNLAHLSRLSGRPDEAERWLAAAQQRSDVPRAPLVAQVDSSTSRAGDESALVWLGE